MVTSRVRTRRRIGAGSVGERRNADPDRAVTVLSRGPAAAPRCVDILPDRGSPGRAPPSGAGRTRRQSRRCSRAGRPAGPGRCSATIPRRCRESLRTLRRRRPPSWRRSNLHHRGGFRPVF
ncbi:hypothetical protein F6X53_01175 [Methylobacterium soli]|uniref:Uncharacterized protein n=1 Tax=Methylobacterium soli TaxID=553447 RepID=A0A6L3T5P8_9HYPH|nr:hypothetical protein F6X53_01175 [Methylobacterium soli]